MRARLGAGVQCGSSAFALEDVLEREGVLVLRAQDKPRVLQADQHGDPRRHVPALREEPILDPVSKQPSEVTQRLLDSPTAPSRSS